MEHRVKAKARILPQIHPVEFRFANPPKAGFHRAHADDRGREFFGTGRLRRHTDGTDKRFKHESTKNTKKQKRINRRPTQTNADAKVSMM